MYSSYAGLEIIMHSLDDNYKTYNNDIFVLLFFGQNAHH